MADSFEFAKPRAPDASAQRTDRSWVADCYERTVQAVEHTTVAEYAGAAAAAVAIGTIAVLSRSPISLRGQFALLTGRASEPFAKVAEQFATNKITRETFNTAINEEKPFGEGFWNKVYSIDEMPDFLLRVPKGERNPLGTKLIPIPYVSSDPSVGQAIGRIGRVEILNKITGDSLAKGAEPIDPIDKLLSNLDRLDRLNSLPQKSFDAYARTIAGLPGSKLVGDFHPGNVVLDDPAQRLGLVDTYHASWFMKAWRKALGDPVRPYPTGDDMIHSMVDWPNDSMKPEYASFEMYRKLLRKALPAANRAGLSIDRDNLKPFFGHDELERILGEKA